MEVVLFIILRLVLSGFVGAVASSNNKSFVGYTALAFFTSPIIGYIFAN